MGGQLWLGGTDRKEWLPTSMFLPENPSPWGRKKLTIEQLTLT